MAMKVRDAIRMIEKGGAAGNTNIQPKQDVSRSQDMAGIT